MTDIIVTQAHNTVVIDTVVPNVISTGLLGPRGLPGVNGIDGQDGTNGTNGTNGQNGTNGRDGVDGGVTQLAALQDVDTTSLNNGSVLVYNPITQKWTAKTLLDQQIIESGQY